MAIRAAFAAFAAQTRMLCRQVETHPGPGADIAL
jgi:hypothetical protein